jgi:uncharacterized linocin/CFP29 family protein
MQPIGQGQDANAGPLSEEEWRWIDQEINTWVMERMTALSLLDVTHIGAGKTAYEWSKYNDVGSPVITYTYEEEGLIKTTKTPTRADMIGIRVDFEVSKLERDANGRYETQQLENGLKKLDQFIDRAVYRGYDVKGVINNTPMSSVVGLFNWASVNTMGAGGSGIDADDSMVTEGDYPHTIKHMISKCVEDYHYGPYDLIVTDGCYQQMITNESTTTGLSDLERVLRIPANNATIVPGQMIPSAIQRIVVTPNLLSSAEVNAGGEMLLLDNKKENMDLLVNYDPTRVNLFNGGLTNRLTQQFAIITGLATRVRRPNAVCITVTLTNNVLSA